LLIDWIRLARPKHWAKNVFVLMPVPFSIAAGAHLDPISFALGLLGFCLINSATYAFNDARDAEHDRLHPEKSDRPVAAGRISKAGATIFAALLATTGVGLVWLTERPGAMSVFGAYIVLQIVYSSGAKHVPLLDVFLLSTGFLLRVILGTSLLEVTPSGWLLLCSSGLALLLALGKRRADIVEGLQGTRPALDGYNQGFLEQAMGIAAALTITSYALYCMAAPVLKHGRELATLPFVLFGVLDYLRMAWVERRGSNPVELVLRSPSLWICGIGWILAALWSLSLDPGSSLAAMH